MKSLGSWNVRVDPGDKLYRIRGGRVSAVWFFRQNCTLGYSLLTGLTPMELMNLSNLGGVLCALCKNMLVWVDTKC
jgi:hypothetical protein